MPPPGVAAPTVATAPARARTAVVEGAVARSAGLAACLLLLAACCVGSLVYGSVELGWGTVWSALTAFDGSTEHVIVRDLRVPRTLIGLVVGAALALAGALMQGVTRNPLAEPGILGVNAGASMAVVLAIFVLGVTSASGYVWFALAGAAAASAAVYALGSGGRDGASPVRLVLAGAVTGSLLTALTSAVLVSDVDTLDQYRFWVVGSLAGRDMGVLLDVLPFIGAGMQRRCE